MTLTLCREAFNKLIDEDLAYLLKQKRTLERDHIEQILLWCKINKSILDRTDNNGTNKS